MMRTGQHIGRVAEALPFRGMFGLVAFAGLSGLSLNGYVGAAEPFPPAVVGSSAEVQSYHNALAFLQAPEERQQIAGLEIVHRLILSPNVDAIESGELELALRPLVLSESQTVASEAARALIIVAGDKAQTADLILLRSERSFHATDAAHYIHMLFHNAVSASKVRPDLIRIAKGETDARAVAATGLLLRLPKDPPANLLTDVLRHAQDAEFFADPTLTKGIMRFGSIAKQHINVLAEMRERLEIEQTLPLDQRTLNVMREGDSVTVNRNKLGVPTLERVIAYLSSLPNPEVP